MTELSPAQKTAQKTVAAFNGRYELCGPFDVVSWEIFPAFDDDWVEQCLAAALEAVADQVVPYEEVPVLMRGRDLDRLVQRQHTRTQLLAIAAELRGDTATTQETP